MKRSIRNWLIIPFIGLFLLPLLLLGGILSYQNYLSEKERVKQEQQKITEIASEKITSFLQNKRQTLNALLKTNYLPGMPPEELEELLSLFQASIKDDQNLPVFNRLSFLNKEGLEIIRATRKSLVREKNLRNMSDADVFRVPISKKSWYYSPVYFDEKTGEPYLALSLPVEDLYTQEINGIIVAEIGLKSLWQTIATMHIGKRGSSFITTKDGRIIAHRHSSTVLKNTTFSVPVEPTIMEGISGEKSLVTANELQFGEQVLFFVTEVPVSEAFKHINTVFWLIGIFFLFFLAGGILLGFMVMQNIVKPIETLARSARNISEGNYNQTTQLTRMDELGNLSEAFNTMTSKLFSTIAQLESEKDFVQHVIESLTHPFYVIDVNDYTIKLANSAAKMDSFARKQTCYELTHNFDSPCSGDEHPCPIQEILKTKKPVVLEHIHQLADDKKHTIEIYGYPIFDKQGEITQVIEYNLDVTEKKNLELQLRQSQKLEAVGTLTGGIAHDFNNLLTTVIGYSHLALMKKEADDPERELLETISDSAEKAAELVGRLLAFSRKQLMEIKVINLNPLIQNISKMMQRVIGENIEIQMFLNDSIGNIKADPSQVEQVIMNLAVNARDAMPNGGKLYFESDSVELDEEYCKSHVDISPGFYVLLSVTDTGDGIAPEILDNIFDPFFTTKQKGEGTGLGLATVYGIVTQMKGHIYVYSEPGRGTSFKIYFPEVSEEVDVIKKEKASMLPGTETILVVDDEPSILKLVKDTLQPLGYNVMTVDHPEEALEMVKNMTTDIDLLLTDVIMQTMNGAELSEGIKLTQPNVKVLYMSGYTDNVIAQKGIIREGVNFIHKPIFPTVLTNKIRSILDDNE